MQVGFRHDYVMHFGFDRTFPLDVWDPNMPYSAFWRFEIMKSNRSVGNVTTIVDVINNISRLFNIVF